MDTKIHYRKAFDSPYLSSADIVEPIVLTIQHVKLEKDHTKRTQDSFNTAYFTEPEIRPGEKLKPMILNAMNSKAMHQIVGSPFIDDWINIQVVVYVDPNVRFGKDIVEGLRIRPHKEEKPVLTPASTKRWEAAKKACIRDGSLDNVLERVIMSEEHQLQLISECKAEGEKSGI